MWMIRTNKNQGLNLMKFSLFSSCSMAAICEHTQYIDLKMPEEVSLMEMAFKKNRFRYNHFLFIFNKIGLVLL